MTTRRLWLALVIVIVGSFAVLGYYGYELYQQAPPIPRSVQTTDGTVIFTAEHIRNGQNVWQSIGGQEVGTVWGHGAYVAPDWSADWLHREATWLLDAWAKRRSGTAFNELDSETRAALEQRLRDEVRTNTYDPSTKVLTVSPLRAEAIGVVGSHYAALFGDDAELADLREAYAIPANSVKTTERQEAMNAFFFWASWACATNRPGKDITYTNNWPPESLIGNRPTGPIIVWSVISFVLLLGGIGALAWYFAVQRAGTHEESEVPARDPLLALSPTPSMRATLKYFWVVAALIVAQVFLGAVTAHYGVEGSGFYGFPLAEYLPYAVTRTWHTQLGIFWIATAWLATGLFVAPAVSGYEPPYQRFGVNVLFVCLLVIVVGSLTGQWLGVQQKLGYETNFWFGHQGLEYVDLGRFWQIFLFVGLFLWLFLMGRAMWPALRKPSENRALLTLFFIASLAIAVFYGAGLMWGRQTNLAIIEYWRWWVVHLWVEGFFEVFATAALAFIFSSMGLVSKRMATIAALASASLFLLGGVPGTFHHLYFSGTTTPVMAVGATFSALEVVPLIVLGHEAWEHWKLRNRAPWMEQLRWPLMFFVAVAFWNMLGAGILGFTINPPIALYYIQGLNTTATHAHAALFGVYGFLALGFTILVLRYIRPAMAFDEKLMKTAFYSLNGGLALMLFTSLLPVGIIQFVASASEGLWYARSESFMQSDLLETLRWVRTIGDVVFIIGALAVAWQVVKGLMGRGEQRPLEAVPVMPASRSKAPEGAATGGQLAMNEAQPDSICCGSCGGAHH